MDRVVDPLGGSYYVEYLTDEMEKRAMEYIRRIDEMGGIIRAVEEGYPQKEIGESAYRFQREVEQGERLIVGVNAFKTRQGTRRSRSSRSTSGWPQEQVARIAAGEGRAQRRGGVRGAGEGRGRLPRDGEPHAAGARGGEGLRHPRRDLATCSARSGGSTAKVGMF